MMLAPLTALVPGPNMQKKFGKPGTVIAEVGIRRVAPCRVEFEPVEASDVDGPELVVDVEAGGPDQVRRPVGGRRRRSSRRRR